MAGALHHHSLVIQCVGLSRSLEKDSKEATPRTYEHNSSNKNNIRIKICNQYMTLINTTSGMHYRHPHCILHSYTYILHRHIHTSLSNSGMSITWKSSYSSKICEMYRSCIFLRAIVLPRVYAVWGVYIVYQFMIENVHRICIQSFMYIYMLLYVYTIVAQVS